MKQMADAWAFHCDEEGIAKDEDLFSKSDSNVPADEDDTKPLPKNPPGQSSCESPQPVTEAVQQQETPSETVTCPKSKKAPRTVAKSRSKLKPHKRSSKTNQKRPQGFKNLCQPLYGLSLPIKKAVRHARRDLPKDLFKKELWKMSWRELVKKTVDDYLRMAPFKEATWITSFFTSSDPSAVAAVVNELVNLIFSPQNVKTAENVETEEINEPVENAAVPAWLRIANPLMLDNCEIKLDMEAEGKTKQRVVTVTWEGEKMNYRIQFPNGQGSSLSAANLLQATFTVLKSRKKGVFGKWTDREAQALVHRKKAGETYLSISISFGRNEAAVKTKGIGLIEYAPTSGIVGKKTGVRYNWKAHVTDALKSLPQEQGKAKEIQDAVQESWSTDDPPLNYDIASGRKDTESSQKWRKAINNCLCANSEFIGMSNDKNVITWKLDLKEKEAADAAKAELKAKKKTAEKEKLATQAASNKRQRPDSSSVPPRKARKPAEPKMGLVYGAPQFSQ